MSYNIKNLQCIVDLIVKIIIYRTMESRQFENVGWIIQELAVMNSNKVNLHQER